MAHRDASPTHRCDTPHCSVYTTAAHLRERQLAFLSALSPSCFVGRSVPRRGRCCRSSKRKRVYLHADMNLFEPVHTLPEFFNQIIVSCGIGLMGIAGAKATEHARALTAGDRKADHMEALAQDIDSFRRRRELADVKEARDWNDVSVDRFANIVIVPEVVPESESHEELQAFDKLLLDSPAAQRAFSNGNLRGSDLPKKLPRPTDFETGEEDDMEKC